VRRGVIHVVSLAHVALTRVRGDCLNSRITRVKLATEVERLTAELALLREELRIKDARMRGVDARRRPQYAPTDRMAILVLKAARNWTHEAAAQRFFVTAVTVASWSKRIDEGGENALVTLAEPVNRFDELVAVLVRTLKSVSPHMGKLRIVQTLARSELHLTATTVKRMLDGTPTRPHVAPTPPRSTASSGRTVTAKYPDHVWNIDMSVLPASSGFWVPWIPRALPQCWPFAWWTIVVSDHFSRAVVGFAIFRSQPSADEVCSVLERCVKRAGKAPRYTVTDRGAQFGAAYCAWCARHRIRARFGAIGKHGSIAIVERFFRTLKQELIRRIVVPLNFGEMCLEMKRYMVWCHGRRPHRGLGGATPYEIYSEKRPANQRPRFEPRARYPARGHCAAPQVAVRGKPGVRIELLMSGFDGAPMAILPVVELKRAA